MVRQQITQQLADNLKLAREKIGVTQLAIAESLDLDRTAIVKIEAGLRQVSALELKKLATLYETTPSLLLGMPDESDAIRKTYEHIELVKRLLGSAQIELMRRQFTHDRSKLQSPEWEMFAKVTHKLAGLTYGSDEYNTQIEEMKKGPLAHHYDHNRHHPEYFEDGINGMNLFDVLEMFIDWCAAVQRHNDGDIHKSIEINQKRFGLSDQLVAILENTVYWIVDDFAELNTQQDLEV